jgi:glycosyltransferase involved in cell wall biosynthesis
VIGTRAGGVPELIDEGKTGLLVPPGDSGALAAAIRRLLDDPALRERMGKRARERAQERFTVARHVASVQAVYDELL